jgi:ribose transport system substrate-binding protein
MKTQFSLLCLLLLFGLACEGPPRDAATNTPLKRGEAASEMLENIENEEYVMVTTAAALPFYVRHDQVAFKKWGEARGVKVSIVGPPDWDIPGQVAAIEQVISTRPTGLLINGTDPGLATVINKAVDAGIPTVVYDSDIPNCRRHCFLGSDWYQMGFKQGEAIAKLAKGRKGKVAALGILGMSNEEAGFQGLQDALKKYPGIEFVGKYECKNTIEESARVTSDLISAYPDLLAVSGFTSETGPGIALAVKERNKAGQVLVTNVDAEPTLLRLMKEGVIQYLVEQKREVFIWYGSQFLWDMAHNANAMPVRYLRHGVHSAPYEVNTGLVEIFPEDVDELLE